MKKVILICCLYFLSISTTYVLANDGNLKIDANLNISSDHQEITYIEQESELTKLFQEELTQKIEKKQEEEKISYENEKKELFKSSIEVEPVLETYRTLLFTPQINVQVNAERQIRLKEVGQPITWQMILLFSLGLGVMLASLSRFIRRK